MINMLLKMVIPMEICDFMNQNMQLLQKRWTTPHVFLTNMLLKMVIPTEICDFMILYDKYATKNGKPHGNLRFYEPRYAIVAKKMVHT